METVLRSILVLNLIWLGYTLRELPYLTMEEKDSDDERFKLTVSMPLIETNDHDRYICYSMSLDEIGVSYILSSTITADVKVAHHIETGVCSDPRYRDTTWDCTRPVGQGCKGNAVNFGGWERYITSDSAQYKFPKDVSLKVGGNSHMNYLLLQIHFSDPVRDPKTTAANVTIEFMKNPTKFNFQEYMLATSGYIPGNTSNGFFAQMGCEWKRPPSFAFRYMIHTHHYGLFAEGFLIRNKTWIYLGGQLTKSRQKVQYDIPNGPIEIRTGDILAARCLYINHKEMPVNFGSNDGEEMCNFQLDIGYDIQYAEYFTRPPACISESPGFNFCHHDQTAALCAL